MLSALSAHRTYFNRRQHYRNSEIRSSHNQLRNLQSSFLLKSSLPPYPSLCVRINICPREDWFFFHINGNLSKEYPNKQTNKSEVIWYQMIPRKEHFLLCTLFSTVIRNSPSSSALTLQGGCFPSDLPVLTESPCSSQCSIYLGIKGTAAHPGHVWGAEYKEDAQQSRLIFKLETTRVLNGNWLACGKTLPKNTGRIRSRDLLSCAVTNCALKIAGSWF